MPLASYDYDYYEYTNGRRVNKTSYSAAPAKRRTTTTTSQTRSVANTTSQARTSATRKTATANTPARKKTTTSTTTRKVTTRSTTTNKTAPRRTNTQKKKYDIDIPIRTSSKIVNKPKEMTLKKPKAKKSAIALKDAIIKTFGVVVFFVIAFAICYRYSLMNEQFIELKNVKKEYESIQNVNEQIQADIESKTDLTYIENYAKYQLGMQKPSTSQMRYVNIENQDKILTPITIEEETDKGWFESVCEEVRKFLD